MSTLRNPQILIHQIDFTLPNDKKLFSQLSLAFACKKIGLVGRNGIGKSTLFQLMLAELPIQAGSIQVDATLAYVPQNPEKYSAATVAEVLNIGEKWVAWQRIAAGSVDPQDFTVLDEDWLLTERVQQQLQAFGLSHITLDRPIQSLSGGETTRLLLARAFHSDADFLLLDEPTNHLDASARAYIYQAISTWPRGIIVVSHDRELLNLMEEIVELTSMGVQSYGGNYDNFQQQKHLDILAKEQALQSAKQNLQQAKTSVQQSKEKLEQRRAKGVALKRSGRIDKLTANSKKGRSERTQSKLSIKEERQIGQAESLWQTAKENIEQLDKIDVPLPKTYVPNGKMILEITDLSFALGSRTLFKNMNLAMYGPERLALVGDNGSGKTTLVKLILGELKPAVGTIRIGTPHVAYLDQSVTILNSNETILANFLRLNPEVTEQAARLGLAQFLFREDAALKLVANLSGGERLRAALACVLLAKQPPQLLILDEPTNHLDLASIQSIEYLLKNYQGAMIVISHDQHFLINIGVDQTKRGICLLKSL